MARKGKSLEKLVTAIERVLAHDKTVTVESPKRLRDRTTGRSREHDVVLTIRQGHHTLMVAIECRDRSRPVGVPEVEAFSAKCQDTGVSKGILVSPRGFCTTARKKAEHLGIRCLDLKDVDSFKWLVALGACRVSRKLLAQHWQFLPEKEGVVTEGTMEVLTRDGMPLGTEILTAQAQRLLNERLPEPVDPTEQAELRVRIPGGGAVLRNTETAETTPVKWALVKLTYSVTQEFTPFRLAQYRDDEEDQLIADVAVAELRLGDTTGSLMVVHRENDGGQVFFVPSSPANTQQPQGQRPRRRRT